MPQSFADELRSIPMSPNLGQSLERAHRFARDQSHRLVTLEHLLLALTEDPEAAIILQSANVDLGRLSTDVSGYLGRLMEDMRAEAGAEPRPDPELLRVLQAAASAAQQSKRRQIDGAIVLAAIVGDGKSPAAGLLKALGMTFEEAIRALQRANAKARLKPMPKPAAPASDAAPAVVTAAQAEPEPAAAEPSAEAAAPATHGTLPNGAAQPSTGQSPDEILAAVRARIQQRTGATAAKPTTAPAAEPESANAAEADASPEAAVAGTQRLTEAIEAAMAASATRVPPPTPTAETTPRPASPPAAPPAPPVASAAQAQRPAWTPPVEQPPSAPARLPPPPAARAPLPFPARPVQPGEGPRRPPLPPRAGAPAPPQPGFPNRPPRAPWPEPAERTGGRPAHANGSYAEAPTLPSPAPALDPRLAPSPRPGQPQRPAQRTSGQGDKGPLMEHIPRRMRVGVPVEAEVRIPRDRIEGLILTLSGRGSASAGDAIIMRALSVRLRAPDGSFLIEPSAPETQWVESATALIHDDYATWRWTVVPRQRGRAQLALIFSARTIGRDGFAAEVAPPDRIIDVRVRPNYRDKAGRWAWGLAVLLAGVVLGRFAEPIWPLLRAVVRKTAGI